MVKPSGVLGIGGFIRIVLDYRREIIVEVCQNEQLNTPDRKQMPASTRWTAASSYVDKINDTKNAPARTWNRFGYRIVPLEGGRFPSWLLNSFT